MNTLSSFLFLLILKIFGEFKFVNLKLSNDLWFVELIQVIVVFETLFTHKVSSDLNYLGSTGYVALGHFNTPTWLFLFGLNSNYNRSEANKKRLRHHTVNVFV